VKEPSKDDERLAALFDGRLDATQREELLAHLSAGGEDYAVYTEAAAILQAMEEREQGAASPARRVLPFRRPGVWAWATPARVAALAAVLAAVAVTAILTLRRPAAGAVDPVRLAARADPGQNELPDGGVPGGSAVRGGTPPRTAAAAHAGALLVDLSVAVQSRDTADTQLYANRLLSFERAKAASPLRRIAERPAAPRDSLLSLVDLATKQLSGRLDNDYLGLGAWTEAARVAARQQNAGFFHSDETRTMLARAAELTRRNAPAHAAVERIRSVLAPAGEPDWAALDAGLRALFGTIAS